MDKYYTPSLDEFYVGFEYEVVLPQWYIQEFRNTIVGTNEDLDAINNCIKLNRIFVKYLDKEDIEELGFTCIDDKTRTMHGFTYSFETHLPKFIGSLINVNFETSKLMIWYGHENNYFANKVFYGTVKNKSELKKILLMIGIL
jgi:hypothetical protein